MLVRATWTTFDNCLFKVASKFLLPVSVTLVFIGIPFIVFENDRSWAEIREQQASFSFHGYVRPTLGIRGRNQSGATPGVVVTHFESHSVAQSNGLKEGDLIYAIESDVTPTVSELGFQLLRRRAGESVLLRIMRSDEPISLSVSLVSLPGRKTLTISNTDSIRWEDLGLSVQNHPKWSGVVVRAASGASVRQAGLWKDDRIIAVDGEQVTDLTAVRRLVRNRTAGSTVTVQLVRNDLLLSTRLVLQPENETPGLQLENAESSPNVIDENVFDELSFGDNEQINPGF